MRKLKKVLAVGTVAGTALVASTAANAAIDVSGAVSVLTGDGALAITAIGGAMLGLAGLAVVFKWAKASIFG